MTDMLRRVARALCPSDYPFWGNYVPQAHKIIELMREPSEEMILACAELPCSQREVWQRSIDAALGKVVA